LDSKSSLSIGMQVSNSLIQEMEVVGFINSCFDEDLFATHTAYNSVKQFRGIINHATHAQLVLSNHLYQIVPVPNGKETFMQGILTPIYQELVFAENELAINIEELYMPALQGNHLYNKIKARIGTGVEVSDYMLRKADFPMSIQAEEGKAVLHIQPGELLCKNKHQQVKSVGINVLAVCRYIHPATGIINYAQFNLSEIYVEYENNI